MGLFKNDVGRPSNETLKKRRIIYLVIILVAVLGIGTCVFYTVNYFKGTTGTDKNISTSKIYSDISIKNNSGAIYEDGNKTNKGNFKKVSSKKQEIELSSNKASITIRTTYNKDVIKGRLSGLKKYYYQVQIASYDKNDREISKSKKIDIKKTTIDQTITTGSTVASIRVKFYDATKEHAELTSSRIMIPVGEKIISNMSKKFPDERLRKCVLDTYNKNYGTSKADITDSELMKIKHLDCDELGVKNTSGLEYLKELTVLDLTNNAIETINLKQNTKLVHLYLYGTKLKSIDLSKNTKLEILYLGDNENYPQYRNNITSLDVSKNVNLEILYLYKLHIKKLNISKNTKLEFLEASYIGLKSIDVSKNVKLMTLSLYNNNLKSLDVSKNVNLEQLELYSNKLTSLDVSKNTKLKELDVLSGNNIKKANIKVGNNKNLKIS